VTASFNRLAGYRISEIIQGMFESVSNLKWFNILEIREFGQKCVQWGA